MIKYSERVFEVTISVLLDSGKIMWYQEFRVRCTARDPAKCGIRSHSNVTIDEVTALAAYMTWKSGVMENNRMRESRAR
jgi:glutamate dehydrogenase/leucine dehydrogenase